MRTRIARIPASSQATFDTYIDKSSVQINYVYYDEFGRETQSVACQRSSSGKDLIKANVYDAMGRQSRVWLPYTILNSVPGAYRGSATSETAVFYSATAPGDPTVATTAMPYSETSFDMSPLGRIIEQGYPGESWQLGTTHTTRTSYSTNANGEIRKWSLTGSGASSTTYPAGMLFATTIQDENGNTAIQFKDFNGRLICKKVQGASSYLYTDYVYDDAGNLCYVIPPLPTLPVVVPLPASFTETDAVFLNFFYGYHYDGRNRSTEKKIPGKGWEYYVYNKLDQPILSQNPSQMSLGVWMFSKFDSRGRAITTGEYTTAATRATLQATVDSFGGAVWEKFDNSTGAKGYTDASYPDNTVAASKKILTVAYYDNYNFLSNASINPNTGVFAAPSADSIYKIPSGLSTGSLTNILGASAPTYLLTVNHYDDYGHNVKTISQSFKGGSTAAGNYDVVESQYSFQSSLTTKSKRQHYLAAALQFTITNFYNYDFGDRKILSRQQTNSNPIVNLTKYDYNEIGSLITKHLHSTSAALLPPSSGFMQHIDMRYNIRNWLIRINNPTTLSDETFATQTDLFAEQIDYDHPNTSYTGAAAQFNGNISTISWKSSYGTPELRGYVLLYDPMNRLYSSAYKSASGNDKYNENVSYDELGNILSLNRNTTNATTFLNKLAYNYGSGSLRGNQLLSVSDNGGTDSYNSSFTYLPSGSEKLNSKKSISQIDYNELNLPSLITFSAGKTIGFIYSASGEKLERIISQGPMVLEDRSYIHGIEYTAGNGLEFIHTEEGMTKFSGSADVEYYNIYDHLGNLRGSFMDADHNGVFSISDITSSIDYYAFGRQLVYFDNPAFQYKFNGKEFSTDLEEYDYGARYFNPTTARWSSIDNDAEKSRRWNPYTYAYNNPIRNIDFDGNFSYDPQTAYANAVGSFQSKIIYNAANEAAYEFDQNAQDAQYLAGQIDHPAVRFIATADDVNGMPMREFIKFMQGNGGGNNGGSRGMSGFSGGNGGGGMFGNMGSFLLHFTPFGGIVDFTNSAREGDVGGAILGLAATATFFTGEGAVSESNVTYRALTAENARTLEAGMGVSAKAPTGSWTAEQHLIFGSSPASRLNDPWLGTTPVFDIASSFNSGNGIIKIDLNKIPSSSIDIGWQTLPRTSPGYQFSVWQQEIEYLP